MGACLTPTPDMEPWYNVEANTGHAEITATTYLRGWYRIREEGGATDWRQAEADSYTEEERTAAWLTLGAATFASPAAPVSALLAALDQILQHPTYERWAANGGQPTPAGIRAARREDGRLLITGPFHRHPEEADGDHIHSVELLYSDVAPIRDAVANLDNPVTPGAYLAPPVTVTGNGSADDPYVIDPAGTPHP